MSRQARNRAAAAALAALVVGVVAGGQVSGTFALFSAETQNANSAFAGSWVAAPTGISAPAASGNGAYFTWTVGSQGVAAQEIRFADQGTTSSCSGASYTNALLTGGSALSSSATSLDGNLWAVSSAVPANNQGDYICYEIRSTHTSWYTAADTTAVQVGLVPTGVSYAFKTRGSIDKFTSFTINFNHSISYSGSNNITVTTSPTAITFPGIGSVSGTFGGSISCSATVTTGASSIGIALGCGGNASTTVTGSGSYTAVASSNVTASIGPAGHAYTVNQCNIAAACKPSITW